jgi:hypothetical protein
MSNITAAEVLAGTIEFFAKQEFPNKSRAKAISKFLDTPDGRELYADHVDAMRKLDPAANEDAIRTLWEKKVTDAMARYGESRQEAELRVGPIERMDGTHKAECRKALDVLAETLAKNDGTNKHAAMLKVLDGDMGKRLYAIANGV